MTAPAVIDLRNVQRRFADAAGSVTALADASLALHAGEFVAVTGRSGSGKSTLLNLAAMLDAPSRGSVCFRGTDVSALVDAERCALRAQSIGVIFQAIHLMPAWSAIENVAFRFRYLDVNPADARRRAMEALDRVGMARLAHRPARLLSGGEAQRVAIARAIVNNPLLLAADEPTGNLDRQSAHTVIECLRALNRDGVAVLLVTHDAATAAACPRRYECHDGYLREAAA